MNYEHKCLWIYATYTTPVNRRPQTVNPPLLKPFHQPTIIVNPIIPSIEIRKSMPNRIGIFLPVLIGLLLLVPCQSKAQLAHAPSVGISNQDLFEVESEIFSLSQDDDERLPSQKKRLRQGLLLATMTVTTFGYGFFSMKYNGSRADAEKARQIYLDDIKENAILYAQTNQELDQLPTYLSWDDNYQSALQWRERAAEAGLLTGIIAIFTVLDAVVTWQNPGQSALVSVPNSGLDLRPVLSSELKGLKTSIKF